MLAKLEAKQVRLRGQDNRELLQPVRFLTCDNGHRSLLSAQEKHDPAFRRALEQALGLYETVRCPYCFTIYELQGGRVVRNDGYIGPFRYGDRLEAVPERYRKGHDE